LEPGGENLGARANGDETAVSVAEEGRLAEADILQWLVKLEKLAMGGEAR
jgi:hypothetical protein